MLSLLIHIVCIQWNPIDLNLIRSKTVFLVTLQNNEATAKSLTNRGSPNNAIAPSVCARDAGALVISVLAGFHLDYRGKPVLFIPGTQPS